MGYIIALVLLAIVVPLLFLLLSRRTTSAGGLDAKHDRGVTVSGPSSDQPTPRSNAVNQASPGAERRLPPG
jgi:hypothetical protein